MRQLTLEEEEEAQQRCEKSPSEAMEDPGPGGLHVDPTDSKTLQGTALRVEGPLSQRRRLMCAVLLLTRPLGGEGDGLGSGQGGAQHSAVSPRSLSHESRFPGFPEPSCTARQGFFGSDFSVREALRLARWDHVTCCLLWGQPSAEVPCSGESRRFGARQQAPSELGGEGGGVLPRRPLHPSGRMRSSCFPCRANGRAAAEMLLACFEELCQKG